MQLSFHSCSKFLDKVLPWKGGNLWLEASICASKQGTVHEGVVEREAVAGKPVNTTYERGTEALQVIPCVVTGRTFSCFHGLSPRVTV